MNCDITIHTECCANNCSKATDKDSRVEEYEVSSDSDSEEEETTMEDIEKSSVKTFPFGHRP